MSPPTFWGYDPETGRICYDPVQGKGKNYLCCGETPEADVYVTVGTWDDPATHAGNYYNGNNGFFNAGPYDHRTILVLDGLKLKTLPGDPTYAVDADYVSCAVNTNPALQPPYMTTYKVNSASPELAIGNGSYFAPVWANACGAYLIGQGQPQQISVNLEFSDGNSQVVQMTDNLYLSGGDYANPGATLTRGPWGLNSGYRSTTSVQWAGGPHKNKYGYLYFSNVLLSADYEQGTSGLFVGATFRNYTPAFVPTLRTISGVTPADYSAEVVNSMQISDFTVG